MVDDPPVQARLSSKDEEVFRALAEEELIELQISITDFSQLSLSRGKQHLQDGTVSVPLSVIVYGHIDIYNDIGAFFQSCDMYLQDPVGCDRNVPYRNPHRLSGLDDDVPMTSEFSYEIVDLLSEQPDTLETLYSSIELPEIDTPWMLKTHLLQ